MQKAVILFNLGGPDKLESVEPFLFNLFNDPAIISIPSIFRYPMAKLLNMYPKINGTKSILLKTIAKIIVEIEPIMMEIMYKGETTWIFLAAYTVTEFCVPIEENASAKLTIPRINDSCPNISGPTWDAI